MRSIVQNKSQRDLSHPWPLTPFYHPLMSDFDVHKMMEKQSIVVRVNSSGKKVGGMSGWDGEVRGKMQYHKRDTRKSHFSVSVSICHVKEGSAEKGGRARRRYGAG